MNGKIQIARKSSLSAIVLLLAAMVAASVLYASTSVDCSPDPQINVGTTEATSFDKTVSSREASTPVENFRKTLFGGPFYNSDTDPLKNALAERMISNTLGKQQTEGVGGTADEEDDPNGGKPPPPPPEDPPKDPPKDPNKEGEQPPEGQPKDPNKETSFDKTVSSLEASTPVENFRKTLFGGPFYNSDTDPLENSLAEQITSNAVGSEKQQAAEISVSDPKFDGVTQTVD